MFMPLLMVDGIAWYLTPPGEKFLFMVPDGTWLLFLLPGTFGNYVHLPVAHQGSEGSEFRHL